MPRSTKRKSSTERKQVLRSDAHATAACIGVIALLLLVGLALIILSPALFHQKLLLQRCVAFAVAMIQTAGFAGMAAMLGLYWTKRPAPTPHPNPKKSSSLAHQRRFRLARQWQRETGRQPKTLNFDVHCYGDERKTYKFRNVLSSTPFSTIKNQICEMTQKEGCKHGVSPDEQRIFLVGTLLNPRKTLAGNGVSDGADMYLVINNHGGGAKRKSTAAKKIEKKSDRGQTKLTSFYQKAKTAPCKRKRNAVSRTSCQRERQRLRLRLRKGRLAMLPLPTSFNRQRLWLLPRRLAMQPMRLHRPVMCLAGSLPCAMSCWPFSAPHPKI